MSMWAGPWNPRRLPSFLLLKFKTVGFFVVFLALEVLLVGIDVDSVLLLQLRGAIIELEFVTQIFNSPPPPPLIDLYQNEKKNIIV